MVRLATGDADGPIVIWDVATGEELLQISGYEGEITDLIFSRDGKRVFSANTDTSVIVWALDQAIRLDDADKLRASGH